MHTVSFFFVPKREIYFTSTYSIEFDNERRIACVAWKCQRILVQYQIFHILEIDFAQTLRIFKCIGLDG